eukprot:26576_1
MTYDHSQRSPLFEVYIFVAILNTAAVIIAYVWYSTDRLYSYGSVLGTILWFVSNTFCILHWLCEARYHKFLTISDQNQESLKISWNHPENLDYVQIQYANILSFKKMSSKNTATKKTTLEINANGRCPCCSCCCPSCDNMDMIEIKLSEPITYNHVVIGEHVAVIVDVHIDLLQQFKSALMVYAVYQIIWQQNVSEKTQIHHIEVVQDCYPQILIIIMAL